MPCYHPLNGWYASTKNPSGRRSITFRAREGIPFRPLQVPCGQCIGCKLERARVWAIRCVHEAQLHQDNAFITLTYSNENLPPGGTLRPRDFVLFMKRLRKHANQRLRFFHCGEYGSQLERPHHHALLFGYTFSDRVLLHRSETAPLYRSPTLEQLWPYGFSTIGAVNFETASYVARYCTKKITGPDAEAHYRGRHPEYVTMSRKPGIGRAWFDKYKTDVYPSDQIVIRGRVFNKPPRYYDEQLNREQPKMLITLKKKRLHAAQTSQDNTGRRLTDRGDAQQLDHNRLTRSYENG